MAALDKPLSMDRPTTLWIGRTMEELRLHAEAWRPTNALLSSFRAELQAELGTAEARLHKLSSLCRNGISQ